MGVVPMVVILGGAESFAPELLHQLVRMLRAARVNYNLPLVLLFTISSANSAGIHGLLPAALTDHLNIEAFRTRDTLSVLDMLFQALVIEGRLPLRLGPHTVQWLSLRFLSYDYSIH